MQRENKKVVMSFRVTEGEYKLIKQAARAEKLEISEYVRLALMMDMALFSNRTLAWKDLALNMIRRASQGFDDRIRKIVDRHTSSHFESKLEQLKKGI